VSLLLHRRLTDARIRATSKTSDIALLWIFWVQLALGLATIPLSAQHLDGSVMVRWPNGAAHRHLPPGAVEMLAGIGWSSRRTCSWA
jgi:nitrate reductase gamma subunit